MILSSRAPGNPALVEVVNRFIPRELQGRITRTASRDINRLLAIIAEWPAFTATCDGFAEVGTDEVSIEEFAVLKVQVDRLARLGVEFDPLFIWQIKDLEKSIRGSGDDPDEDADVADSEVNDNPPTSYPTRTFISRTGDEIVGGEA
jgi:hypothetical protein